LTIPTYDYDKRHWKKIYGPEELNKIGELLTGIPSSEITFLTTNNKPTVRVRRKTKYSDSILFSCAFIVLYVPSL
jgi:hypothetical protein